MIYFDTETCGFHGPIILIQYSKVPRGEYTEDIHLYEVWKHTVQETFDLIKEIVYHPEGVVAFNLVFDWFHLQQLFSTCYELITMGYRDTMLLHVPMNRIVEAEYLGRTSAPFIRPQSEVDLMLFSRKGPYQSVMDRRNIVIKRIPTVMARDLVISLDQAIKLKDIYFSRQKKRRASQWSIRPTKDPDFVDIVLGFAASAALKVLAEDVLGMGELDKLGDISASVKQPKELGYAPYAKAGSNWPEVIFDHIAYWGIDDRARAYARRDVELLMKLDAAWDFPKPSTDDNLTVCVACNRWRGYALDIDLLKKMEKEQYDSLTVLDKDGKKKLIPKDPRRSMRWLQQVMTEDEKAVITSTSKISLENLEKYATGELAKRAGMILRARQAKKKIELLEKLRIAERFHASFRITGTLSNRMAGADKLNPQGINSSDDTRSAFTLADLGLQLCGGDFESFEVTIAEMVYADPDLRKQLLEGVKIHALFGTFCFPELTYEQLCSDEYKEFYKRAKSALFAMLYGGTEYTMCLNLGVTEDDARIARQKFETRFPGVAKARMFITDRFTALKQLGDIGSKIQYREPADYVEEQVMGHRRYFTLENMLIKALYDLAQKPPPSWAKYKKLKVIRRDRVQNANNAAMSACYGAAFSIQQRNIRAAGNHVIQSPGAMMTKELQKRIWELQPRGIHEVQVQPMNIHDEIMCPAKPELVPTIRTIVEGFVEEFKAKIPLLAIKWEDQLSSWKEK